MSENLGWAKFCWFTVRNVYFVGTCVAGWEDHGTGFCYLKVFGEDGALKRTWTDAANYCDSRGGQLMKITK